MALTGRRLTAALSVLLGGARTFSTGSTAVNFPGVATDPAAVWRGEGEQLTSGDPTYRRVRASIRKLQSFVVAPNEALDDSRPEIARLLESQIAAPFGLGIDRAAFGAGQAVNANAAPAPFSTIDGRQVVDTLGVDGGVPANLAWLTAAISKLLIANGLDEAALFLSPRTFGSLLEIKKLTTGSNEPLLWTDRTLDGGPIARLLGVPVFVSSALPDTLTTGSSNGNTSTAWLIDMRAVFVVVRHGTKIEIDRSRYFDTDSTAIRGTMRCDVVAAYPELFVEIPGFKVS